MSTFCLLRPASEVSRRDNDTTTSVNDLLHGFSDKIPILGIGIILRHNSKDDNGGLNTTSTSDIGKHAIERPFDLFDNEFWVDFDHNYVRSLIDTIGKADGL